MLICEIGGSANRVRQYEREQAEVDEDASLKTVNYQQTYFLFFSISYAGLEKRVSTAQDEIFLNGENCLQQSQDQYEITK